MPTENLWHTELSHILLLAAPIMTTNALSNFLNIEDQIFLGHLGTEELAGAAIGNTYFSMLWFFLFGCSTAIDTLVSQAFGTGDVAKVNFWTKQGYVALSLLNIPAGVLLYCSPWVIEHVLGQERAISELAGLYCRIQIPGLFFLSAFTVLQKAQQAQNNLAPSVWVAVLANVFNIVGNYCLIWGLGLGYVGSPLATSLSRVVSFILLALLSWYHPPPSPETVLITDHFKAVPSYGAFETSSEKDRVLTAFHGLGKFLLLGLPGGCMMLFESWSFLIITIESGFLGVLTCAASQVMMSYCSLIFLTFGAAIGQAGTIRVGNMCGAQQPIEAKTAATICIGLGSMFMFALGVLTYTGRFFLGPIFSNDPAVWAIIVRLAPLAGLFSIFDGFQACCSSVLRAIGRQFHCAIIYGIGFWIFGVPGGAVLCFWFSMGVFGLWWGVLSGLICVCMLSVFVLVAVDWKQEAKLAWEATQVPSSDST
jgi:MATE family multidrug resistance protein